MSRLRNKLLLFLLSVVIIVRLYSVKWECVLGGPQNGEIKLIHSCLIMIYYYNNINRFCDCHSDWVQVSQLIKQKNHSLIGKDSKLYNNTYWGTERLGCGDNSDFDDIIDSEVFLFTQQDSIFTGYKGELTDISFGKDVAPSNDIRLNDVGDENRKIIMTDLEVSINYMVNDDGVNIELLREFEHSINFDSYYAKKYQKSTYKLINKDTNKCLASIRYVEYGKQFYFDVYDQNKE